MSTQPLVTISHYFHFWSQIVTYIFTLLLNVYLLIIYYRKLRLDGFYFDFFCMFPYILESRYFLLQSYKPKLCIIE